MFKYIYIDKKGELKTVKKSLDLLDRIDRWGLLGYCPSSVEDDKNPNSEYNKRRCKLIWVHNSTLQYTLFQNLEAMRKYGFQDSYHDKKPFLAEPVPNLSNEEKEISWTNNEARPFVSRYHGFAVRKAKEVTKKTPYKFGVEVEKGDKNVLFSELATNLHNSTGWRKEWDRSLGKWGFEIISPIYDFYSDQMFEDIYANETLLKHINASTKKSCGGHITISSVEHSSLGLYRQIENFIPLLYALYPARMSNKYCKALSKEDMEAPHWDGRLNTREDRYRSILLKPEGNMVEFRIFPAVKDVAQLHWRVELLRIMFKMGKLGPHQIARAMVNSKSPLYLHLSKKLDDESILKKSDMYLGLYQIFGDGIFSDRKYFIDHKKELKESLKKEFPEAYKFIVGFCDPNAAQQARETVPQNGDWVIDGDDPQPTPPRPTVFAAARRAGRRMTIIQNT